jgi:hypothetical protein
LPLAAGLATALLIAWKAPRTPVTLATGFALCLLATVLLSKQAFVNYYALIAAALTISIATWKPLSQPDNSAAAPGA